MSDFLHSDGWFSVYNTVIYVGHYTAAPRHAVKIFPSHGIRTAFSFLIFILLASLQPGWVHANSPTVTDLLELTEQGEFEQAYLLGEQLLSTTPESDLKTRGETFHFLGLAALHVRDDSTAMHFLNQADAVLDQTCTAGCDLFASTHDLIARCHYRNGEFAAARLHYEKALREWLGLPQIDSVATANTMVNLGKTVAQMAEYKRALELYEQARAMVPEDLSQAEFDRVRTYLYSGNAYYTLDQYPEAKTAYSTALFLERKKPQPRLNAVAILLNNIAATVDQQGDLEEAIERYEEALQLSRQLHGDDAPGTINIYSNIGLVYLRLGKHQKAEAYYSRATKKAMATMGPRDPLTGEMFGDYAFLALKKGEHLRALELVQAALHTTAPALSRSDWRQNPSLDEVIDMNRFRNNIQFKGLVLLEMADTARNPEPLLHLALESYDLFTAAADLAWEVFSNPSDKLYLNEDGLNAYENAIRCAAKLYQRDAKANYLAKIFTYMERGKFQVMLESIRRSRAAYISEIPKDLREEAKALRESINAQGFALQQGDLPPDSAAALRIRLLETKLHLSQLTDSLKQAFPAFEQMTGQRPLPPFSALREEFTNAETALIEYFLGDTSLFVLTGHPTGNHFRETHLPPGFRDSLLVFQNLVQSPHATRARLQRYQQLAFFLFKTLLQPELSALPETVRRLRIVPDGLLSVLPFDALISDPGPEMPRSHGQLPLLIYDYLVSYAPSAALLADLRPQSTAPVSCLGFAWNADAEGARSGSRLIQGQNWPSLPGTVGELSAIEAQIDGQFFMGDAATEARFKTFSGDYGLLHLALHGYSAGQEPYILFPSPGDSTQDGILYLHELYNLPLQARLAVLSACETGAGNLARGEGVMSVASGFASAGCPSVLMSVWPVDDKAGSTIIRHFYDELIHGQPLDEALHQAKLKFMKSGGSFHTAPFYWAPFIVLGDVAPVAVNIRQGSTWYWVFAGTFMLILTWIILRMRRRNR